jgi:uncharacterized membrane-anchored protein YitT (DUF2179 family)
MEYKKRQFPQETLFSQLWFINYGLIIVGSIILALGFSLFIIPHHLVPGGVFGLSIVINHLIGLPVGLISLVINIPLVLFGFRILGTKVGIKTIVAMVIMSVCIDLVTHFRGDHIISDDLLVSAIFGGAFIGIGIALVIRAEATTGGTDLMAQIIAALTKRPIGQLFLLIDGLIVLSGIVVFKEINLAPYAVIAIFANSRTVDALLNGKEMRKAVFIISEKHEEVRRFILSDLDRGGTYLDSRGLYFPQQSRNVIFSVLNRKELARLQNRMKSLDPSAFLTVFNAQEIFGSGFKPFK